MSCLFLVATPIGNLKDITYRAVQTLKDADIIACEDTRVTARLLDAYGISGKKLMVCNAVNEDRAKLKIASLLDEGKNVALVTDAGTPGISDPGARVVDEIQKTNHTIVPIPGPCAAATTMCIAGNAGKSWIFEGFLPKGGAKMRKRLRELLASRQAFVLYESPFRIVKLLEAICEKAPERRLLLAREMTKIHEEHIIASAEETLSDLRKRESVKGEFCVLVYP